MRGRGKIYPQGNSQIKSQPRPKMWFMEMPQDSPRLLSFLFKAQVTRLKFSCFGHSRRRLSSLEKVLMLRKTPCWETRLDIQHCAKGLENHGGLLPPEIQKPAGRLRANRSLGPAHLAGVVVVVGKIEGGIQNNRVRRDLVGRGVRFIRCLELFIITAFVIKAGLKKISQEDGWMQLTGG